MVLATLADTNAATLYGFAAGLEHVDGPAWHFRAAIYYLASDVEAGKPASGLTEMTMRSALRNAMTWNRRASIDTLENAQSPFWEAVRGALVALRAECVTQVLVGETLKPEPCNSWH